MRSLFVVAMIASLLSTPRAAGAPDEHQNLAAGGVVEIAASPGAGFFFPYLLYSPRTAPRDTPVFLLVEPNNTGTTSDDLNVHRGRALSAVKDQPPRHIADAIRSPLLVPIFPRRSSDPLVYTHALDRDSMLIEQGDMRRLDLQLIAMIEDAHTILGEIGVETRDQVFMSGFSASGTFVNRFTSLHPERVRAVAAGGINAFAMLPFDELSGDKLNYPIGTADAVSITGRAVDLDSLARVSQFLYMGAADSNDTLPFDDAWDDSERELLSKLFGQGMMPTRWLMTQALLIGTGFPIQCVTYESVGHEIRPEMIGDIAAFFVANLGDEPAVIETYEYAPLALGELETGSISALMWHNDPRIPKNFRATLPKNAVMVAIREWIHGRDHAQLDELRERAGFSFALRSDGHPEITLSESNLIGTLSTNDGVFQAYAVALSSTDLGRMSPEATYTIHPLAGNQLWSVEDGVELSKRDP